MTNMITSIHTLIYSDDANATRAFLRDVLGWKYVAEDFDNDWLIFKSGPSEMGVHPTHSEWEGQNVRLLASPFDRVDVRQHRYDGRRVAGERSAVPRSYRATRVRPRYHDDRARGG